MTAAEAPIKETRMRTTLCMMLTLLALSACTPLVVVGAGAVVADEVLEERNGDDGLF